MSFLKNIFSLQGIKNEKNSRRHEVSYLNIYAKKHSKERYVKFNIDGQMLSGCFKLIENYFNEKKIERVTTTPINHPLNLDLVARQSMEFESYCSAHQLGESDAAMFLAYAFSDFVIVNYSFKLFIDMEPEYPLRGMVLIYEEGEHCLSLFPFEYASKVLKLHITFVELEECIKNQLTESLH